jgi:pyruvate dehydrogenase E1 component
MSSLDQISATTGNADDAALETQEWLDALEAVLDREGPERAHFLLERLVDLARRSGAHIPFSPNTAYVNTIPPGLEPAHPGDLVLEERIRSYVRWNAMAMVVRANSHNPPDGGDLGGHIASFASLATMIGCG